MSNLIVSGNTEHLQCPICQHSEFPFIAWDKELNEFSLSIECPECQMAVIFRVNPDDKREFHFEMWSL